MADISDKAKKPSNSKSKPLDVGAPTSMDYNWITHKKKKKKLNLKKNTVK